MRATVAHVAVSPGRRVTLKTDFGTVSGDWEGELPALGQPVHVELDVARIELLPGGEEGKFSLADDGEHAAICGKLETSGGLHAHIRIGPAILLLGEDVGEPAVEKWVKARASGLRFFPQNL